MDAGSFRYPVTIYRQVKFTDERGSAETRLKKVRSTKCAVLWQNGYRHMEHGNEIAFNDQFQFLFRHYIEIDATCIIVYKSKKYRVISTHEDLSFHDIVAVVEEVHP